MTKLILGTAQFGSDYGIKHDGQPCIKEIEKIAQVAWDGGIRIIHTSWQYPFDCIDIFDNFESIHKSRDNPKYFWHNDQKGLSIYGPEIILTNEFSMIQYPLNVLDRRCLGFYPGMINIARSVFFQGLLLMDKLPEWVNGEAKMMINAFQIVCKTQGCEYYEGALGWVLGLDEIDKIIIGVNSAKQLEQLLAVKPLKWNYDFSIMDENVLDPRRWPKS